MRLSGPCPRILITNGASATFVGFMSNVLPVYTFYQQFNNDP